MWIAGPLDFFQLAPTEEDKEIVAINTARNDQNTRYCVDSQGVFDVWKRLIDIFRAKDRGESPGLQMS